MLPMRSGKFARALYRRTRHRQSVIPAINRSLRSLCSSAQPQNETPSSSNLLQLLNDDERQLLLRQKEIVADYRSLAKRVGVPVDHSENVLEDCAAFSVVVAGEYNAGKSTLINALLGQKILKTGSIPTTDSVTILSAHPPPDTIVRSKDTILYHELPQSQVLQDITLIDTPGTNAVLTDHTVKTLRLLPSADWILFVTSADRPLSESERSLLESMAHTYRKNIAIVLTKMDVLDQSGGIHGADEKNRVLRFVTEHARVLLGAQPIVIPVSARDAMVSSRGNRSNLAALHDFLSDTLTSDTKLQSKLTSPLSVAEHGLRQCLDVLMSQRERLQDDEATLILLSSHVEAWRREIDSEMERTRTKIRDYMCEHQGQRGYVLVERIGWLAFLTSFADDSTMVSLWVKTAPLDEGARAHVKSAMEEAALNIATRGRAQGQSLIEFLGQRMIQKSSYSLVGKVTAASDFEGVRQRLVARLQGALDRSLPNDDVDIGSLLRTLRLASLGTAGSMVIASCALAVDMHAIALVSVAIGISSSIWGRSMAPKQHLEAWTDSSRVLDTHIAQVLSVELEKLSNRVTEGISPFQSFLATERSRLDTLSQEVEATLASSKRLSHDIHSLR